jgi:excisionase family DNA binding protein
MPVPLDLMKVTEACKLANVHEKTVRAWMRKGQITYYGRPGHFRISLADLLPEHPKRSDPPAQSKAPTRKRRRGVTASGPDSRYAMSGKKRDAS